MWKQHKQYIVDGNAALLSGCAEQAEQLFSRALDEARREFRHTDPRIPETFAWLGHALLLQKKLDEARPCLRQSVNISRSLKVTSKKIQTAKYLLAYLDREAENGQIRMNETFANLIEELGEERAVRLKADLDRVFDMPEPEPVAAQELEQEQPVDDTVESAQASEQEAFQEASSEYIPESKPEDAGPILPEEVSQRPELSAAQRNWLSKFKDALNYSQNNLAARTRSYFLLHDLLPEVLEAFSFPHSAIAEHIRVLAEIAECLKLERRAEQLYLCSIETSLRAEGEESVRLAYARLLLAQLYCSQDRYMEAETFYRLALRRLSCLDGLDNQWLTGVSKPFLRMWQKEKIEREFFLLIDQIQNLCMSRKYENADVLALEAAAKLAEAFSEEHYNYVLIWRRHAMILRLLGREPESRFLEEKARLVEQGIIAQENTQKLGEDCLPFVLPASLSNLA